MGAKRILALGSVAALCAGAAAPLFIASEASAAPIAHSICATYNAAASGGFGLPIFTGTIYGVNLTDAACNAFSPNGGEPVVRQRRSRPERRHGSARLTGPSGAAGPTGGTGGTGTPGAPGLPGPQGPQGVTGAQGGTGGPGGTGPAGPGGLAGVTGSQGLVGNDGLQGGTGIQGGIGPIGPSGGIPAVTLVVGPVQAPTIGGATFAGNFTVASAANCPAGTVLLGGGGHVGLTQGAGGALSASFPSGQSWVAIATVTHASPNGTITAQAYAFCQATT